ncbi:cysteine--tRNA ligase [Pseudoclavibacter endophyticus]|uniref:Cysteine--tRNA ligase n=1 Tax=Pseudoclavibacter endophyticus TaxID=1778590 RepID=A0A6H9WES5_9MICO|nr:cysteine--tRNA ligase [Pseudoclavibacter endophyticus]KAB1649412.1 cysteine--tRNA ligase [Pseudoclavibacter endophyticus]GGA62847.1 cysteine--tRNA ligase [Pseudoclavibacter endophyticus]
MTQRFYDTKTQALRDFAPLVPGEVSMYVCGPTVQSGPHVGHIRSALVYDQLRRWLEFRGVRVTLVRNVTDIDDKTLANATDTEPWWALAYRVEREFTRAYARLGIRPPTYEPRATASIMEMQAIIRRLIERGHAYVAADGTGDVYFETSTWPEYGSLTHQRTAEMEPADDGAPRAKRGPHDFALWKGRKPGEPESASWPSPWGPGRPGWHIECSAMSTKYLGDTFDIHGGGLDLRFPHHENEMAQSNAAGHAFARTWLHNGLVNFRGQKMSKSVGNIVTAADLFAQARPIVIRYVLGAAHYRSVIELNDDSMAEGEAAFARIESFLGRAESLLRAAGRDIPPAAPVTADFEAAMLDDLAIPQALAALHGEITRGNQAADANDTDGVEVALAAVGAMLDVLGIDPRTPEWAGDTGSDRETAALATLVEQLLEQRREARSAKDFTAADRIRDALAGAGITVADSPTGTTWSVN